MCPCIFATEKLGKLDVKSIFFINREREAERAEMTEEEAILGPVECTWQAFPRMNIPS